MITIQKDSLEKALTLVKEFYYGTKSDVPNLARITVQTSGEVLLTVTGTLSNIRVPMGIASYKSLIKDPINYNLSIKDLIAALSYLDSETTVVNIEPSNDSSFTFSDYVGTTCIFDAIPDSLIPPSTTEVIGYSSLKVNLNTIHKIIRKGLSILPILDHQYNAIFFAVEDGHASAIVTDTYRFFRIHFNGIQIMGAAKIPTRIANVLNKLYYIIDKINLPLTIVTSIKDDNEYVAAILGNFQITLISPISDNDRLNKIINRQFPPYNIKLTLDRTKTLQAFNQLFKVVSKDDVPLVRIDVDCTTKEINLLALPKSSDHRINKKLVILKSELSETTLDQIWLNINPKYVSDALSTLDTSTITLSLYSDKTKPVMISSDDEPETQNIISPIS